MKRKGTLLGITALLILTSGCNGTADTVDEPLTGNPITSSPDQSSDSKPEPNPDPDTNPDLELPTATGNYLLYGAGNVSKVFNPEGYGCVEDWGYWIFSAGVTEPGVSGCDSDGTPIGQPSYLQPQVTGPAAEQPVAAHRWWGSVSFLGEMQIGDPNSSAYITPDPITARISNSGVRVMGIPSGLRVMDDKNFQYPIPDPFSEVFDGLAIGNSAYDDLEAYLKDSSDGAMTVEWQAQGAPVMEATFAHGSPYVFFKSYQGQLVIRTLRDDSGEKGTFYQQDNILGLWTNVAGNRNEYLVVGEGETSFSNVVSNEISVSSSANEMTLVLLPNNLDGTPSSETVDYFASLARNVIDRVDVDYVVDHATNQVSVTHSYLDAQGKEVETIAGMHPLHWKNASLEPTKYSVRSARGTIKYTRTDAFSYDLPFVGVLPYMPSEVGDYDDVKLKNLIHEFIATGQENWNTYSDTYWAGKNYGKVAELAAIARSIGMTAEADLFINWLKDELSDWFTANTSGGLDKSKYFVYDEEWNTLLGVEESFLAHQQLNDHHFHYGYFVRAAAEICRVDVTWCSNTQYGPMIELLIRDYAGGRNDPMFPYLRHFDPANGFSWASGMVNFARGNNNESTSEAANAYGSMVLYGLITGKEELVDRGTYLHASTTATYWEYWNNIDRHMNMPEEYDNFPANYDKPTTSIIWGDGAVFSTWFSGFNAHILGIQGLPTNALTVHVAQYPEYMAEYIDLGLSESSNSKPSGLVEDQWRDIWWNLWAMNDAGAAISDYNSMPSYTPEEGETKAHTYHWLHTWKNLGHMISGTGDITANSPAAMVFEKDDVKTYVVYNFSDDTKTIEFSDGTQLEAQPYNFSITTSDATD